MNWLENQFQETVRYFDLRDTQASSMPPLVWGIMAVTLIIFVFC